MGSHLLVVSHSKTGGTTRMLEAVLEGAHDPAIEGVAVRSIRALDAVPDDVIAADGILLGTPANFGYMSGALKYFFDSVYHEVLGHTRGLPYGLFVKGSTDAEGAVRAVEPLVAGLGWKAVAPPVLAVGDLTDGHLEQCYELGAVMAAGLAYGGIG